MTNLIDPSGLLWLAGNALDVHFIGKDDHARPFETVDTALDFTGRSIHQDHCASGNSVRSLAIRREREIPQILDETSVSDKSVRSPAIGRERENPRILVEMNVRERFLRCSVDKMKSIP